jgi:hypothetical protein
VTIVYECILVHCGPHVCPALAHAVLKGIVPLACVRSVVYSELGLHELLSIMFWLQAARYTVLVAGAALIGFVASVDVHIGM